MKKIVIIGNSPAGVKAIEEIRAVDQESFIAVIDQEGTLPYNRSMFPELLAGAINEKQSQYQDESFLKKLNVEIIKDKTVIRMNSKRNKIVLENKKEEKEDLVYDILIITDAATKLPDLKGNQRSGVFGLRRFADAQAVLKILPLTDEIIVQTDSVWGLEIIEALRKKNKEVIWLNPAKYLFSSIIDAQTAASLKQQLEAQGIRILEDNAVAEVLGDQETKAVRLKSGKVLAAEMILFPDSEADLKIYTEGGLAAASKITVNASFQTSAENVFALDDVCDFSGELSLAVLEEQGKTAAAKITGKEYAFTAPVAQDPASAKIQKRLTIPGEAVVAQESQSQPA